MKKRIKVVKFPKKIGHKYTPIELLPLELLHTKYSLHRRLKVFHHKGCVCVKCGIEGVHLVKAMSRSGAVHVDLYTADFKLMTIDHIIPKSKGGLNHISNLDPMCSRCNEKKGDKI